MSRSVRKNPILKYGGDTRESWKECKKMINRYNRRKSKEAIRNNEDIRNFASGTGTSASGTMMQKSWQIVHMP